MTVWMRKPEEEEYVVEPDIFHDFFGHVPLLLDPVMAHMMERHGAIGAQALAKGPMELALAGRLFWRTVEFGMLRENGKLRAYGAGILSSRGELLHATGGNPKLMDLNALATMKEPIKIDNFQPCYWVADGLRGAMEVCEEEIGPLMDSLAAEANNQRP